MWKKKRQWLIFIIPPNCTKGHQKWRVSFFSGKIATIFAASVATQHSKHNDNNGKNKTGIVNWDLGFLAFLCPVYTMSCPYKSCIQFCVRVLMFPIPTNCSLHMLYFDTSVAEQNYQIFIILKTMSWDGTKFQLTNSALIYYWQMNRPKKCEYIWLLDT